MVYDKEIDMLQRVVRRQQAELEPHSDAALLAEGWATLTPLVGVHEDQSDQGDQALAAALATFGALPTGPR